MKYSHTNDNLYKNCHGYILPDWFFNFFRNFHLNQILPENMLNSF